MPEFKETLESFASANQWKTSYARRDYQNLIDIFDLLKSEAESHATGETFVIVDPIVRDPKQDPKLGKIIDISGNFMVLTNSDLDGSYENKYQNYVKPIIDIVEGALLNNIRCSFDVKTWQIVEVVNAFDFNSDGVSVKFSLTQY